jgi:hypothetical protein
MNIIDEYVIANTDGSKGIICKKFMPGDIALFDENGDLIKPKLEVIMPKAEVVMSMSAIRARYKCANMSEAFKLAKYFDKQCVKILKDKPKTRKQLKRFASILLYWR